jgi:hypothetical protein
MGCRRGDSLPAFAEVRISFSAGAGRSVSRTVSVAAFGARDALSVGPRVLGRPTGQRCENA